MISNIDIQKLKQIFIQRGEKISQAINSVINWNNISGKPSTFTPSSHSHVAADITDLKQNILNYDSEIGAFILLEGEYTISSWESGLYSSDGNELYSSDGNKLAAKQ